MLVRQVGDAITVKRDGTAVVEGVTERLGAKLEENVLVELDRLETEGEGEGFLLSEVRTVGARLVADLAAADPACRARLHG